MSSSSTLPDLLNMGFPSPLARAASYKFPTELERAADYALNPPPDWESTAKQDQGIWEAPKGSQEGLPAIGWEEDGREKSNRAVVKLGSEHEPQHKRQQSPPPSRPEPLPSYFQDQQQQQTSDAELARALQSSMQGSSGWDQPQSQNSQATGWDTPIESSGAQAGWSASTGTWSHQEQVSTAAPKIEDPLEALQEAARQLPAQGTTASARSLDMAVQLVAPSRYLAPIVSFLQALYATSTFRSALLSLPLPYQEAELSYEGYDSGDAPTLLPHTEEDHTRAKQLHLLKSLQRLFVLMHHSRRARISILDVCHVLALGGVYQVGDLQDWPQPGTAFSAMRSVVEAWKGVVPTFAPSVEGIFTTRGRTGPHPASGNEESAVSAVDEVEDATTTEVPLEISSSITTLYAALEKTLHGTGAWIFECAPVLLVMLDRRALTSNQTHVLKLEEELRMERFMWQRREEVCARTKERQRLVEQKESVGKEKEQMAKHEGKDYIQMLQTSIQYLDKHAVPSDETQKTRQEKLRAHFQRLLTQAQARLADKDVSLTQIEGKINTALDFDATPATTFNLQALASSTGLQGENKCFGYFRHGQGWFKQLDARIEPSTVDDVLADETGSWVGAGPYFLIYAREDQGVGEEAQGPQGLIEAVKQDNNTFQEKLEKAEPGSTTDWATSPSKEPRDVPLPSSSSSSSPKPTVEAMQVDDAVSPTPARSSTLQQEDSDDDLVIVTDLRGKQ